MFDPKIRVLVVDDMLTMRKIVSKILRDIGFQNIVEAPNGNAAWELIASAETPFGLVVSDWNMPVCTGLELLKKIRTSEKYAKTPFVLVTAEAEQHQVAEAVKAGVDQYVVKPFCKDDIIKKLNLLQTRLKSVA